MPSVVRDVVGKKDIRWQMDKVTSVRESGRSVFVLACYVKMKIWPVFQKLRCCGPVSSAGCCSINYFSQGILKNNPTTFGSAWECAPRIKSIFAD